MNRFVCVYFNHDSSPVFLGVLSFFILQLQKARQQCQPFGLLQNKSFKLFGSRHGGLSTFLETYATHLHGQQIH